MSRRGWVLSLAVLTVVALVLAACGGDDDDGDGSAGKAAEKGDLVIGHVLGKTGFLAFYDVPVQQGAEIRADELNAEGGVAGRKIKFVRADMASEVSQSATAAEKVLGDGAEALITPTDANLGGPAARAANDKGILAVGGAGGTSFGLQGIGPLVFNTHAGNATEAAVLAQAAVQQGWKRPYLLEDTTTDYPKQLCGIFEQLYKQLSDGGEVVGHDTFQQTDQSVSSQVNHIKAAGDADVVVLCSYPPGGASALRQIRSAGIDLPVLSGAGFDGQFWTKAVPKVTDLYHTSLGSMYGDDPRPAVNRFFDAYRKKYGDPPISYPLLGYLAVDLIARAVEANDGDTDGEKLAKTIEGFKDEDLLLGPTTYSADCHAPLGRGMVLMRWENGKDSAVRFVKPTGVPRVGC